MNKIFQVKCFYSSCYHCFSSSIKGKVSIEPRRWAYSQIDQCVLWIQHFSIVLLFLCTGVSLYAPYSLLLISKKFRMGRGGKWEVGGGEVRGPS
jgi:hypothetical protein